MSNRIKKKYMAGKTYFDYPTLFLVIFLICFGMVMIYSTSSYKSMMTYGNSYKWVFKQGLVVLGGAIAIFLISRADYRIIKVVDDMFFYDRGIIGRGSKKRVCTMDQHCRIPDTAIRILQVFAYHLYGE